MPTRIDHVIIAGPDLDALEDTFTRMGFHVTGGGTHPHLGTRNRIIVLDESYIELLAIADPAKASPTLQSLIAAGGGWVGYALQSDDIAAETDAMRARGIDARGPTPGRLVSPDGSARSWRVTMIGSDDLWQASFPLPFLIQHDATGEQHRRELAGPAGLIPHPNGATSLEAVRVTSRDAAALAQRYELSYAWRSAHYHGGYDEGGPITVTFLLPSGERIYLFEPARSQLTPALAQRDAIMSVRVHVANLGVIEDLHWHATVGATNTSRTLIVSIPGVNAQIEFTTDPR